MIEKKIISVKVAPRRFGVTLKDDDSDEEATDKSQKPNSSRYEKTFNIRWLNDYSWLKHDSDKGMFFLKYIFI